MNVAGFCPMGCGATLFAAAGGHITCSYLRCPDPSAVDTILADPETHHLVTITTGGFTVQHPLRERVAGDLHRCTVHTQIAGLPGPPGLPGRYRVWDTDGPTTRWLWQLL